jgi:NAD(P)-dependent dehydrogenase (short-subunit alcohol dehydrogenase family)
MPDLAANAGRLRGKIVLITGGTSGIGRTLALGMARERADVIPTSRTAGKCEETVGALRKLGARSLICPVDVTRREEIEDLAFKIVREFGQIDVLINCAGITIRRPAEDLSEKEWDLVIDTNVTGTFLCCQAVGRWMMQLGTRGSIINIASVASFRGLTGVSAYCASKGAVVMLTQALAVEWAGKGIRVNAIAPGWFITPLNAAMFTEGSARGEKVLSRTPMARFGNLGELVEPVVFLASDEASYITGETLLVDGGFMAAGIS